MIKGIKRRAGGIVSYKNKLGVPELVRYRTRNRGTIVSRERGLLVK